MGSTNTDKGCVNMLWDNKVRLWAVGSITITLIPLIVVSTGLCQKKTSENFQIVSSVISIGGGQKSSTNFSLQSSTGQPTATGIGQSEHFGVYAGFQSTTLQEFPEWVPRIRLSADYLDWGQRTVGNSSDKILTIHNDGLGTLEVSDIFCDDSHFTVSLTELNIGGLKSAEVEVTFTPTEEMAYEALLTVFCNDTEQLEIHVQLSGVGIAGCPGGDVGDVNGDATINVLDVLALINHILEKQILDEAEQCRANCKGDGDLNVLDALNIVNVILDIIPECPGGGFCRTIITPETITFMRALEPYFPPEEFARFLALVKEVQIPTEYGLSQNYPNPFNPTTTISYTIPRKEQRAKSEGQGENSPLCALRTTLMIYNILGQEVATLVDEPKEAGYYTVTWDASDMSSGVYFYHLTMGGPSRENGEVFSATKRMVLIK